MGTKNSRRRRTWFLAVYIFLIIINLLILVLGIILAFRLMSRL